MNICKDYKEGMSCIALGGKYHRCNETISAVLKRNGIKVKANKGNRILVYNLNGELLFVTCMSDFLDYIKKTTKYKNPSSGAINNAINYQKGEKPKRLTAYGYVVRHYIDNYPRYIDIENDFWMKEVC